MSQMAATVPSRALCHQHPGVLTSETTLTDARPGRVLLAQSPFFPGGGGQLPDEGIIRWGSGQASVRRNRRTHRQACVGTHLASTGLSPTIRILKIDNKGRHNRAFTSAYKAAHLS